MDSETVRLLKELPDPTDFIQVSVNHIRAWGVNAAILAGRMHFRFKGGWRTLYPYGDEFWWRASVTDMAEETGLTYKQARDARDKLEQLGIVVRAKHRRNGQSDQTYSYRLLDADEAEALLSTDLPSGADQSNSDLPSGADGDLTDLPSGADHHLPSGADLLSLEEVEEELNADAVGDDEVEVESKPNVGLLSMTPARVKLVSDAMAACGQAHAVPAYIDYLRTVDRDTGSKLIARWCGIQAAAGNGHRRADVDELLTAAGLPPTDDVSWQAFLAGQPPALPRQDCRILESGYCDRHGLRADDPGHSPRTVSP